MQEREGENGVRERNVWNKVLDDAGEAWDKRYEGKVKGFFAVCAVPLGDGVMDTDNHCCENVEQVKPDKERQEPSELERCRVAVVRESVDAYSDTNENADDAWGRK